MSLDANLLAVPIVLPLLTAALILTVFRWGGHRQIRRQQITAGIALLVNLVVALLLLYTTQQGQRLVLQMGSWPAPFGITVFADGMTATMLTLTAILMAAIFPYAAATLDSHREDKGFYPLYLLLLMGVNGAFLAGDLFNLYVFFEILLMASFVLLTLGGQPAQTYGGIRYVVLNLLASTIFLAAAAVAFSSLGTLNMAHLALRLETAPESVRTLLAGLLLVAFSSKAGLFPLFFWLPSSYHTPHPAVTALFGGLLTKVGVYTLFRTFPLLFPGYLAGWQPLILLIAGFTMFVGVLGAFAQPTLRRVLSFHVISQVGYMIMGLGLAASGNHMAVGFGLAAGVLYLIHHMLVKTALLMAAGAVEMEMGSGRLSSLGGLLSSRPVLAGIFFVAAFSLAGVPPSSGFVSKLSLLQIALDSKQWMIATVSLVVSLLTTISMARIWQYPFWNPQQVQLQVPARPPLGESVRAWAVLAPIAVLMAISLSIGMFAQPYFQMAQTTADQLLDRQGYIAAVAPLDHIPEDDPMTVQLPGSQLVTTSASLWVLP